MTSARAKLLLHPVRMRVVMSLVNRQLTTRELQTQMPDVPQASLYRAVSQLAKADVIKVISTERRGGAIERRYHLPPGSALLTPEEVASSEPDQVLAAVQTFSDVLVARATRYLSTSQRDWRSGRLTLRNRFAQLDSAQRDELSRELVALLDKYGAIEPGENSGEFSITVAVIPEADFPEADSGDAYTDTAHTDGTAAHDLTA